MARAAVAAALFLFLTVAFANPSDLPPVDQDGSGDDDDSSGSGYEPFLEEEFAHGDNEDKPTEAFTTALPHSPTEKHHPVVEQESIGEKEAGIVFTTTAVETEKLIPTPGQLEPENDVAAEETLTNPGSAVLLVPTTLPTFQSETVKMAVAHDAFPEVHNIPQDQTTESVRQATDPLVEPTHKDGAHATEAIEPHKHHHHHHHHHHHNHTTASSVTEAVDTDLRHGAHATEAIEPDEHHPHHHHHHHHHHHNLTTAASVTEAVDTDLHHVLHQGTSAPSVTHGSHSRLHPAIQEDTSTTDPHVHHPPDADQVTDSNVDIHPTTQDANLPEEDSADVATTTKASYDENKANVPVIVFEPESEPEHTDAPEFDGSGVGLDANDFVFEPSIPRAQAPDDVAVEEDGASDTSKGIMEQKGVLAAVIAGGLGGLVFAVCLVGFMLYRMKKKDEGSYCLEETKQTNGGYEKPIKQEEFYA